MVQSSSYNKGMYIGEAGLNKPEKNCPFCNSSNRKKVGILQREPEVTLLQCQNCFAASVSRMPRQEVLDTYYSNYYVTQNNDVAFDDPDRFATHLFRNLVEHLKDLKVIRILDFGGGDGMLSCKLAEKLCTYNPKLLIKIDVVDYSEKLSMSEIKQIEVTKFPDLSRLPLGKEYDLVLASAVLEHIPSPMDTIRSLFNNLKSEGYFYARTPYVLPFMRIFSKFSLHFDFTFPAHVHDLGSRFWNGFPSKILPKSHCTIVLSQPSLVETSLTKNFLKTLLAYAFKCPWWLLGNRYHFVGGWEIFLKKEADNLT